MLPDLQAAFRAGTIGRDAAAAAALSAGGMQNGHRFGIYRNNIFKSLTGVLEAAFPTIRNLVGGENFAVLAHRFIAAHPPRQPQLYAYGGDFAAFLAGFAPAVGELPFLPDLARVEWAVNEAYFEADAEPLTAGHLAGLAPERYAGLRLGLHPTVRLVASDWPVWDLWGLEALPDPSQNPGPPEKQGGAQRVLVRRPEKKVDVVMLTPGDFAFVGALADGDTLGAAATAAAGAEAEFDLSACLAGHLSGGTFHSRVIVDTG
ncbi:MAG: DNA-binding domain-containing protein [Rhodospirillaceae bacterium]|nr:DNA-binding domain-containing protein [Rhodospirillaceae bacterium]MCY4066756.1 DNA-binding domain-containing protein [Rhodospirillaceae bacterium]